MAGATPVLIGMNDRLFPSNYHPILDDIAFAQRHGFEAIQFHGQPDGLGQRELSATPEQTGAALRAAGITAVMEIIIWLDGAGRSPSGKTPLAILEANLLAIAALGCAHVHWHIGLTERLADSAVQPLEQTVAEQFAAGVALGQQHGFRFAVEHNEPAVGLFRAPASTAALLEATPGLGLVWDLNHTRPSDLAAYLELAPRMTMLHVADTPLPETNHHLPLGLGNVDFAAYFGELIRRGFHGPAILEIGGLPKSGGYGRDTDDVLISSADLLRAAVSQAQQAHAE